MKSITLENQVTHEQVVCDDTRAVEVIDGVEYYKVHKEGQARTFLMRKDILTKISDKKRNK